MVLFVLGFAFAAQAALVTMNVSNVKVVQAMKQLKKLTGYTFVYYSKDIDASKRVSVKATNAEINDVVAQILTGQDVDYTIDGKRIVVSRKAATAPAKAQRPAQQGGTTVRTIGRVTDTNGEPIIGATVRQAGTNNATVTDIDGNFTINAPRGAQLEITYIGYQTTDVRISSSKPISVSLTEGTHSLDELVVVGYGVQKKSNVTGSITSVNTEGLEDRPVENIQQALQGKAPGVSVMSASAAPGVGVSVRIRGLSSNNSGSSEPLYIVDGLKVNDISYLDPTAIKSMEILKDGASAAIYGAEAGNGVVLITTKSGSKGHSRAFYNMNMGWTSVARKPKLMNAEDYMNYQKASGNGNLVSVWDGKTDTDWTDVMYGDGGNIARHTVGFEGGTDKGSLYVQATYLKNNGMYYGDKDFMKRITFQLNASYKIKEWLEFTSNNSLEDSKWENPQDWGKGRINSGIYTYDPISPTTYPADNLPEYMKSLMAQFDPSMFMRNDAGDYIAVPNVMSDSVNPLTWYYANNSLHRSHTFQGASSLVVTPFKGFRYTSRLGYRYGSSNYYVDGVPTYTAVSPRLKEEYSQTTSTNRFYQWENFINYNNTFGKHAVDVMVGTSYQRYHNDYTGGTTNEFTNQTVNFHYLSYSSSNATRNVSGEPSETASISYFGRLGYTFDSRYDVQFSYRADAFDSSKLSKNKRWGHFPSVSAGWNVTNEKFMKNVSRDVLSFLRVRASYGVNGNVNVLSGYPYRSSLSLDSYYPIDGKVINTIAPSSQLANPELKWETAKQVDVGVDMRWLNDRLSVNADYFYKNTSGQLINVTAPLSSGATNIMQNVGKVNNRGFELALDWKDHVGDFKYGVSFNMATLHNEVTEIGDSPRIGNTNTIGYTFTYFDKGQPIWSFWGYNYQGFDKETGAAIFEDVDKNNVIDTNDKVYLGSATPKFTYGITLTAAWKNFDFTVFGNGQAGGKLSMSNRGGNLGNAPKVFWTDSWDVKGASAKYPHPNINNEVDKIWYSNMVLFSSNFFKVKQIELGYTVPTTLLAKTHVISALRLYFNLSNFFTITNYPGMDPEAVAASDGTGIDIGEYPSPKTVSFGINVSF